MEETEPYCKRTTKNKKPKPEAIVRATWALVIATLLLVAVTIALWFATWRIFKEATNQTKLVEKRDSIANVEAMVSDSNIKKSIAISDSSLKVTKEGIELSNANENKSLELAQNAFNAENRPYLYIKEFTLANVVIGKEWTLKSVITNVGKIPALKARCTYIIRLDTFIYHHEFPFDKSVTIQIPSTPPTGGFNLNPNTAVISQERFDAINNKRIYLCFYGKISYTDIFKGDYFTTFCIIYDPEKPTEFIYNPIFNDVK